MTPNPGNSTAEKAPVVKRKFFNLSTFSTVTVQKPYEVPSVKTVDEALAYLGNDSEKLLTVINKGIVSEAKKTAKNTQDGWKNADGTPWTEPAIDGGKVGAFIRNIAQFQFGFAPGKEMSKEEKKTRLQQARDFIQSIPAMVEGLKQNCLISENDPDEDETEGDDEN